MKTLVILVNNSGKYSILNANPQYDIESVAKRDVPAGALYYIVEVDIKKLSSLTTQEEVKPWFEAQIIGITGAVAPETFTLMVVNATGEYDEKI